MAVLIQKVELGSWAFRAGIQPGDTLVSIGEHPIQDVLDYRFYMTEERLDLRLLRGGKPYQVHIKKEQYDDLGLEFETYLMDRQKSCKNKCVFCFVDQMPKGMRESLYFKDDDSRMSFLFGNYITMTNLTQQDIQRIIEMHISPVNISVHTTDPELRVRMMKNPKAADSLGYLSQLVQGGVKVNTQLVLCPGWNDGPALERTLEDLGRLYPGVQSVACVPVGLTKYRQGLTPLEGYTPKTARETIDIIHRFQDKMMEAHGERVAYPSDEFFLEAGLPIPEPDYYGDFDQLEDGVGVLALLKDEFLTALEMEDRSQGQGSCSVATGTAAGPWISQLAQAAMERLPGLDLKIYPIENRFFGERVTVAGLVTGQDLIEQLQGKELGAQLLIPSVMLRHEGDRFLDDITLDEAEQKLGVPIRPVENDGWQLYAAMTGQEFQVNADCFREMM